MERSAVAHQPQDRVPERDSLGLTVVSLALLQTAVLVLEDDMSISPVYATYLELVMGMVSNTSFVVGASLSPIRMAEMVTPAKRWEGSEKLAARSPERRVLAIECWHQPLLTLHICGVHRLGWRLLELDGQAVHAVRAAADDLPRLQVRGEEAQG
jgi:hypothetical protein